MSFDISKLTIIDNHAHSLLKDHLRLDKTGFRGCFTESSSAEVLQNHIVKSTHYMDLLDNLERTFAVKNEEDFLAFRSRQDSAEYVRTLWNDVSIGAIIIDDGFRSDESMTIEELFAIYQRPIFQCRRIENILEKCLIEAGSFDELDRIFTHELFETNKKNLVSLKTICGYRGGLSLENFSKHAAADDFEVWKKQIAKQASVRINKSPLYHYFLLQTFELAGAHSLPVQIHCGIGDDDANLLSCNPALMQNLVRSQTMSNTKFVLLHCFPYVREAAFLASLYPNVYMDLSLSVSLASPIATQIISEALAIAPSTKILAGTDGHSCPEAHWYGAFSWKRGLSQALLQMISGSALTYREAEEIAGSILHDNAVSLYKLKSLLESSIETRSFSVT